MLPYQLGGPDGTTLLPCCAPDCFERNRAAACDAMLVATTVDVSNAGLP